MSTQSLASAMLAAYTVSDRRRFLSDPVYFHRLMAEMVAYDGNCELMEKAVARGAGKVIQQYLDKRIWPVEGETEEFRGMLQSRADFSSSEASKIIDYLYFLAGWTKEAPSDAAMLLQNETSPKSCVQTPEEPVYEPQTTPADIPPEPAYEPHARESEHDPRQASVTEAPASYEEDPVLDEPVYEETVPELRPVRFDITISDKELVGVDMGEPFIVLDGLPFTLEYLYPFIEEKIDEMGLPAKAGIGRLKHGGLLSNNYEDIIVITHSEHPKDYSMAIVMISYTGTTAFVKTCAIGKDKNYVKKLNTQKNSALYNKLTGAAAKAQHAAEESDRYYQMLGNCVQLAFEAAVE